MGTNLGVDTIRDRLLRQRAGQSAGTVEIAPPESTWLFMTRREWGAALVLAFVFAALCYPLYESLSLWLGIGTALTVLTFVNCGLASRFCIPYPQLAS